jgi:hypothetical protein
MYHIHYGKPWLVHGLASSREWPITLTLLTLSLPDDFENHSLILRPLVKPARRSDLPFLRYGHFVTKSQIVTFVMDKLGNINSLDPRF